MPKDKKNLEQRVISGSIELIEAIINNKTNAITLDNGDIFYRAESHVLKIIAEEPGIFSSKIARRFGVTRGAIQKILSRLEERNLIIKEIDASDKKRIGLFLTEGGEQAFKLLVQYQMKINAAFFSEISSMTEDELAAVNRFLLTARNVLKKM
ncbi:MarR family transcriptional regulator [Treponema sp. OMZ 840]|uniref:MarR family winged helix-turn-helix transcriptional regulator n=1 Tax=Treponema sp. OMZ 840 TaxID=244313 RepID=UPI003D8E5706